MVFDNVTNQGGLTLDKDTGVVTGYSDVKSGLSTGATRLFVYGEFDAPVTEGASSGVRVTCVSTPGADHAVTLRLATSLISVDQARDNLRREIPADTDFETVKARAQQQWERRTPASDGFIEDANFVMVFQRGHDAAHHHQH